MKEGLLTRWGRKAAPYLLASTIPLFACSDRRIMPSEPTIQEEYSPQEQRKAEQAQIWYEEASQDNIIFPEELKDLEARIEYKQNDSGKHKAVSLAKLSSETRPNADVNHDNQENIFDLIYLLKVLGGKIPSTEACDIDKNGKTDVFDLLDVLKVLSGYYDTYSVKGQNIDNDTEQGKKAVITIDGKEYTTDIQGNFNVRMPKDDNYVITARQIDENGNFEGFRRTEKIPGMDIDTLKMFSVSYPTQEGVTPELFKAFCWEANFQMASNGMEYTGLKTMFGNPNAEYWISSHRHDGAKATAVEQAYVKSLIENEIYPSIKPQFRPKIYVENPNNIEDIPYRQSGKIVIVPIASGGFYIGSEDDNSDGIIDYSTIQLAWYGWNEQYKGPVIEELLSALVGTGEVSHYPNLTALQSNETGKITQIDDKLINICQRYKPKEQIENILGL